MKHVMLKKAVAVATAVSLAASGALFSEFPTHAGNSFFWGDETSYVNESQTKLVHLDYADYVVITFAQGSVEDYNLYFGETCINKALTKVDDEGTVVKWLTTVVKPGTLKIYKKDNPMFGQEVEITKGYSPVTVKAGSSSDAPDYFLARGTISTFDYYLNPKNSDGTDKVLPTHTTFDLQHTRKVNSENVTTKSYVPAVVIDDMGNSVSGKDIVAEFSIENDAQKKWFEGIDKVTILNQDNTIVNSQLKYATKVEEGAYGTNGVITIPTGQSNMRTCGIYQMNIHSTVSEESVTVPFELVTNKEYTLKQNALGTKVGERLKFTLEGQRGEYYGSPLGNDQKTVTLQKPSGNAVELKEIDDWSLIGSLFTLYENCLDEPGTYRVSIKFTGYPEVSKRFEVYEKATRSGRNKKPSRKNNSRVDAVSRATSTITIGGDGKPSSGGTMYQGKFVLNYDLITNALVLDELKMGNTASENVVSQFYGLTEVEYLYDEGAEAFYSYRDYINDFAELHLDGRETLNFRKFAETAKAADYQGPNKVQNMLEDGSYGCLIDFKFYKGQEAPEFTGLKTLKGEPFKIQAKDLSFVKAIKEMYVDNLSMPLRSDAYLKQCDIDRENGILTIYPAAFNFYIVPQEAKHTLRIETESGYRSVELSLWYVDELPTEEIQEEEKQDEPKEDEPKEDEPKQSEVTPVTPTSAPKPVYVAPAPTPTPSPLPEKGKEEETVTPPSTITENDIPLGENNVVQGKVPEKVALLSVNMKKGNKLLVTWKKITKNCKGYQIQVAKKKTFAKGSIVSTTHTTKTSYSVTLKKRTKYYVRVRAYKLVNGKKKYGTWSGAKKVNG
ncbi:hypothetical protein SAMN02910358_00562 [Lachnospiraceae bacterium XBB1006]|nr:hypothetical protein SAMN02910358_00562 [Lachnospiraceae bacterium XBB1006]